MEFDTDMLVLKVQYVTQWIALIGTIILLVYLMRGGT